MLRTGQPPDTEISLVSAGIMQDSTSSQSDPSTVICAGIVFPGQVLCCQVNLTFKAPHP